MCDGPNCSYKKCTKVAGDRTAIFHCATEECVDVCHACFTNPDLSEEQRACFEGLEEMTIMQRCKFLEARHRSGLPGMPQLEGSSRWWRMRETWGVDPPPPYNPFGPPPGSLFGFEPMDDPGPGAFNPPTAFLPTRPKSPPLPTIYQGQKMDGKTITFELPPSSPVWRLPEIMRERKLRGVTKVGKKDKKLVEEDRLARARLAFEKKKNPDGIKKRDRVVFTEGSELAGSEATVVGIDLSVGEGIFRLDNADVVIKPLAEVLRV